MLPITSRNNTALPTIHIVSDSVGITAQQLAQAASVQFGVEAPHLEILPRVISWDEIERYLEEKLRVHASVPGDNEILLFYTLVNEGLRKKLKTYVAEHPLVVAVDLLGDAIAAIAQVSGLSPADKPGRLRVANQSYFNRISAMEFTIAHDDGQRPEDLSQADIVLLGVSRSSKTPTSIYLSQQGYKVANIPLDPKTEPPKELFEVETSRIFGLVTTPEVLVGIRQRRLGSAEMVASSYADPEEVYLDLEHARALMRKLGCIVIHTDNRAIEETAQEILRYYDLIHSH